MRRGLPIAALLLVGIASSLPAWFAPVRWTPDGLVYQARVLTSRLRVDTTVEMARVLQDDLTNSYSLYSS